MNTATLLHFPIERTMTTHEHATIRNNSLKKSPHTSTQVIPFPGRSKKPFKQAKAQADLSSIKLNTRLYRAFHPFPPKGIRSWGFAIGSFTESFWVHGLPFSIAAKQARREAQRLGAGTVIVLP